MKPSPDGTCEHGIPIDRPCLECKMLVAEYELDWRRDGRTSLEREGGGTVVGGDADDDPKVGT